MTGDQALRMALEGAAAEAYALEEAIGESEAYLDAWPDTYTFTGADGVTEHTFDALTCTFASSSHSDRHVVECKTCAWRERYGNLPRDPCLMYVVPPLCPVCRAHGDLSGVRSRYPAESDKPHAVAPDADDAGLIPDGGEEPDDGNLFSGSLGDDRPGVPAGEGETWGEAAARKRREEAQELRRVCREWAEERFGDADVGDAVVERIVEETDHLDADAWEAAVAEADTPEGDCPADGCPGTLRFARRKPSVIEYDCDTCDTTVPHYPEGQP